MKPYKLEKGIKLPPPARPKIASEISRAAYTMQMMKAGESFAVADAVEAMKAEKSMRDMNGAERKRGSGKQFAARRTKRGLRIWRIR
jgi:hypothetical protein